MIPGVTSNMILEKTRNGKLLDEKEISDLVSHKGNIYVFMSCASISHLKEDLINEIK